MYQVESEALTKVRSAIIDCAVEDMGMVDDLAPLTRDLVKAWNEFADAGVHGNRIETSDIEERCDW